METEKTKTLIWLTELQLHISRTYFDVKTSSLRVFICICPQHCERNSCQNVKTFFFSPSFLAQIVTHMWRAKAKICNMFAFEFFLKFWTFVWSIQSSFSFSFKNISFFKLDQNWHFYDVFSMELFSLRKNSFFLRK